MRVYFDNAATTPLLPEVLEAMMPFLREQFGNPSTQYSYGREARSAIESARKLIASLLHAQPGEIIFTSGGTESSNIVLYNAVVNLGIKRIITSQIEHHCVLHSVEYFEKANGIQAEYMPVNSKGEISLDALEELLKDTSMPTLVTLMHANNEIGVMIPMDEVGALCVKYGALFHSDTVQTFAHCEINTQNTPVDFLGAAAHKFHGPKGAGFLY
ncbi:MAG TPA: aminotransferase class V-fold PLP-dependent enzyme, partial [Chitinophagaceae bacterium]|nr:aminotransferase class V-fold PLP-dependent enzyme [Chitinophagaceae bacterium]